MTLGSSSSGGHWRRSLTLKIVFMKYRQHLILAKNKIVNIYFDRKEMIKMEKNGLLFGLIVEQ